MYNKLLMNIHQTVYSTYFDALFMNTININFIQLCYGKSETLFYLDRIYKLLKVSTLNIIKSKCQIFIFLLKINKAENKLI